MPATAPDDAADLTALLHRVAQRDRTAFAALYQATSSKLYAIVFRILKRRDSTDDVLQDVYVRIWQAAPDYSREKGAPLTWMAAIARNRAIDDIRRIAPQSIEDTPGAEHIASSWPDAFNQLQAKQAMQRLFGCMDGLDAEKREMVTLAYFHGASRDELARKFGRPVATVKTWLHRSLAQLKDCVGS